MICFVGYPEVRYMCKNGIDSRKQEKAVLPDDKNNPRFYGKRLNEDHVGAYAAQSAYFILLSFIIPFVLLVVTLVKYTPLTRRCSSKK